MTLSPTHRRMLEQDSGIPDSVIAARGYRTLATKDEIERLGFKDYQAIAPTLLVPIWGVDRAIVTYQTRPDSPRESRKRPGKYVKYETPAGTHLCIDVPPLDFVHRALADPNEELWITEGAKKADCACARGICCISLMGVSGHRGMNEYGGITDLSDWSKIALKGRKIVYIVFDSDVMTKPEVRGELIKLARMLKRRGVVKVCPVIIPSSAKDPTETNGTNGTKDPKVGLDDYFVSGGTVDTLRSSVDMSILDGAKRPDIVFTGREMREVTDDAIDALMGANNPPWLFYRDSQLVRVVADEKGIHHIHQRGVNGVRHDLAFVANWLRATDKGLKHDYPPVPIAANLLELPAQPEGIPPIAGLSAAPVLGRTGVFRKERGYDPHSHWYVTESGPWETWSGTGAEAAAWLLFEIFGDFPFVDQASRANALALMVLPFVRSIINGPTPMFFSDAPRSRTGKGILLDAALIPALGHPVPITPLPEREEERGKLLYSVLSQGQQVILFDNIKGYVSSAQLEAALTSFIFQARLLGVSAAPTTRVTSIFTMTANNGKLSVDLAGRCVWIRMDSKMENPEERDDLPSEGGGFRHKDLREWVLSSRPKIVGAIMAMVEHWVAEGMPAGGRRKASYTEFSEKVGGILACCGVEGFLGNDRELKGAVSTEDEMWRGFYQAWFGRFGENPVTVKELRIMADEMDLLEDIFSEAKNDKGRGMVLGRKLAAREGTTIRVPMENEEVIPLAIKKSTIQRGLSRLKLVPSGVHSGLSPSSAYARPQAHTHTGDGCSEDTTSTIRTQEELFGGKVHHGIVAGIEEDGTDIDLDE